MPGGWMMDEIDLKILATVQEEFPLEKRPFQALGKKLGLDENVVISRLEKLHEEGLVRRLGPILDIRKLGLSGVLVAVQVPEEEAESVASIVSQYQEVSHNYLRPNDTGYNLWFTVSAKEDRIDEILSDISSKTDRKLLVLPTARIFKIGVKFDIV
jgi:DNA-binding Lrp family transcriptional regulator